MMILSSTCILALTLSAPADPLPPAESAALHARFDPSLAGLRAGRTDGPARLAAHERAALATAEQASPALADLRGGNEMTDNEFRWLVIGGLVVLILVML